MHRFFVKDTDEIREIRTFKSCLFSEKSINMCNSFPQELTTFTPVLDTKTLGVFLGEEPRFPVLKAYRAFFLNSQLQIRKLKICVSNL